MARQLKLDEHFVETSGRAWFDRGANETAVAGALVPGGRQKYDNNPGCSAQARG